MADLVDIPSGIASFGSRTDIGYVREHNEDSMLVAPPLFVVCDGMGGHEAGEVASEIAVQTIASTAPSKADVEALGHAVEEANLAILHAASSGVGREGMGTTCTAAMLCDEKLSIAQVGDSRAYLLHEGTLQQLTRDHSVVADLVESGEISPAEARTHQWRSYITRALGLDPYTHPDLYELTIGAGDRLMLCTDGLHSMVPDARIEQVLCSVADPQECADALVDEALAAGGSDNVTVIVIDATGAQAKQAKRLTRRAKFTAALIIVLMVAIIGGVGFGFSRWVDSSAYLGLSDDKVAIYHGVPGEILGFTFSELEEVTDVTLDSLPAGTASRLKNGVISCDSLEAARELVDEYRQDSAEHGAVPGTSSQTEGSSSSAATSAGGEAGTAGAAGEAGTAGGAGATSEGQDQGQGSL